MPGPIFPQNRVNPGRGRTARSLAWGAHANKPADGRLSGRALPQSRQRLHLRHLSPDCLELLTKAKDMVEIDVRADNKPG